MLPRSGMHIPTNERNTCVGIGYRFYSLRMKPQNSATLGVVIVSYNASDVILDCIESLLAAQDAALKIVIVDNASPDGTADLIGSWAAGTHPYRASPNLPITLTASQKPIALHDAVPLEAQGTSITLLRASVNGGFAAGVNLGLEALSKASMVERFWVLNPDCVVPAQTPKHFASYGTSDEKFSLLGGRVIYIDPPDHLQSDGGTINRRSGVTRNINASKPIHDAVPVAPSSLDFISGSNMVASRSFYEKVGPMTEDYFLYYEEVDWALRRGDLPLAFCADAHVYHHAGSSIGSYTPQQVASPFSIFFLHRSRMLFMKRFYPEAVWYARAYAFAKAGKLMLQGHTAQARMLVAALFGGSAPREIVDQMSPGAASLAFPKVTPKQ